ncbi:hypothetical protein EHI48_20660 [Rhizobium sp. WSM1325]|nr:hypothetical protein EHI48_20660 [Rhizobium leguminosarum]
MNFMRKYPRQEAPSSALRAPSPRWGEEGIETLRQIPFAPAGRRCRQADEGATPANCAENEKRAHGFRHRPFYRNDPVQSRLSMSFDKVSTGMSPE